MVSLKTGKKSIFSLTTHPCYSNLSVFLFLLTFAPQDKVRRLKQSYQYYFNGTADGFLDYRSRGDEKAPGSYSGASSLGASSSSPLASAAAGSSAKEMTPVFASDADHAKVFAVMTSELCCYRLEKNYLLVFLALRCSLFSQNMSISNSFRCSRLFRPSLGPLSLSFTTTMMMSRNRRKIKMSQPLKTIPMHSWRRSRLSAFSHQNQVENLN